MSCTDEPTQQYIQQHNDAVLYCVVNAYMYVHVDVSCVHVSAVVTVRCVYVHVHMCVCVCVCVCVCFTTCIYWVSYRGGAPWDFPPPSHSPRLTTCVIACVDYKR